MTRLLLIAAAATVSGLCLAAAPAPSSVAGGAHVSHATPAPMASDDRDGKYKSDDEHARDIRWLLADVADRAANDDGWKRVADWLSSNDRHRIVDGLSDAKTGEYAGFAKDFRKAWKDKYGSNFNAHKMLDDLTGMGIKFDTQDDRKFATATFGGFGGMAPFEMRLQLEAKDKWRIEIPNSVDADKYVKGLEDGLKNVVDHKGSLVDDEKIGVNAAIAQMIHGLSFEPGAPRTASAARRHT